MGSEDPSRPDVDKPAELPSRDASDQTLDRAVADNQGEASREVGPTVLHVSKSEQYGVHAAIDPIPRVPADPSMEATVDQGWSDTSGISARGGSVERQHAKAVRERDFGEYELIEEIARGGMGVVFRARQKRLNRTVALKMILAGEFAGSDEIQRFHAEAEAAANLQHSGIVPIHEVGEHQGRHYFSMGFVEGETLSSLIAEGPRDGREAATLLVQVSDAIAYAHDHGVIHRDLKPGNILLDAHGQPKVTDFGLAKRTDTDSGLTGTGQILGTPSYMAPEQAAAKTSEIGPLSDVYSLGAILYCLITGRPPFQAASVVDTLAQVMKQEPVSPRRLNPAVDRDLETICLKCLRKEQSARYESAAALKQELERFLNHEPIHARPIGPAARAWRWCRRNPVVAGLSGMVAALLVAAAVAGPIIATFQSNLRSRAEKLGNERAKLIRDLEGKNEELQQANQLEQSAREEERLARISEGEARLESERRTDEANWNLYVARMFSVQDAWKRRDFGHLERLVDELAPDDGEPDYREWEVQYFRDQLAQASSRIGDKPATVLAWHPAKPLLAMGFQSPNIEIWEPGGSSPLRIIPTSNWVQKLGWSPDGSRLAFDSGAGKVTVVDVETGNRQFTLDTLANRPAKDNWLTAIDWSPDGTRIATSTFFGYLDVWDAATGKLDRAVYQAESVAQLTAIDWHADGRLLAAAHNNLGGNLHVWDVETSTQVWKTAVGGNTATGIEWSPSGQFLAAGAAEYVWVVDKNGKELSQARIGGTVTSLQWVDDDTFLTAQRNQLIVLWEASSGARKHVYRLHSAPIDSAAYSRPLKLWASSSTSSSPRLVTDWNPLPYSRFPDTDRTDRLVPIFHVSWSPDGKRLASTFNGHRDGTYYASQIRIRDTITGKLEESLSAEPTAGVDWSPDGRRLALLNINGTLRIWETTRWRFPLAIRSKFESSSRIAKWSPDGKHLSLCSLEAIQVLNTEQPAFAVTQAFLGALYPSIPIAGFYDPFGANWMEWAPDSSRFLAADGAQWASLAVFTANGDGSFTKRVLQQYRGVQDATFSPGSDLVALGLHDGGERCIGGVSDCHAAGRIGLVWSDRQRDGFTDGTGFRESRRRFDVVETLAELEPAGGSPAVSAWSGHEPPNGFRPGQRRTEVPRKGPEAFMRQHGR